MVCRYQLDIVYHAAYPTTENIEGREGSALLPVILMANDELLHDYMLPPSPMQVLSFPIKQATTRGSNLTIHCNQRPGGGGTGRTCEISEVWLRVVDRS